MAKTINCCYKYDGLKLILPPDPSREINLDQL